MRKAMYVNMEMLSAKELIGVLKELESCRVVFKVHNQPQQLFTVYIYGELPEDWMVEDDFDYSGEDMYETLVKEWRDKYMEG